MKYALKISNLRKTYDNNFVALKGIDLKVKEGDFFALLGPNGAGKTTILGILCDLLTKDQGTVKIFNHDIDKDFISAKRLIGVVPQEFNFGIFERVIDIIINQAGYFGIRKSEALPYANELLKMLGLYDKKDGTSWALSGGMKRRLMIARALIHKPKLLILDEPTAGVDVELRRDMWNLVKKLNKEGLTIILTTHNLDEAETLCKNVAIIKDGRIIEDTSIKQLLSKLDKETFILDLDKIPKSCLNLKSYDCKVIDSTTIELTIPKTDSLNKVFKQLEKEDIKVSSIRPKTNRLEELFVGLVNGGKKK